MIIFLILSCALHKDTVMGVIDHIDEDQCVVILENSETVFITSNLICNQSVEGDKIFFHMGKK